MIRLICGRSRAGKTTYSQRFDNVVHLDDMSKRCGERYPKVLEIVSGVTDDITVEGIYELASQRMELLKAYQGEGAVCIWLDTPVDVIKARAMTVLPRTFEPPTKAEGWDEVIRIG